MQVAALYLRAAIFFIRAYLLARPHMELSLSRADAIPEARVKVSG